MSFSPGQIITAQRLNRLQTKSYYSIASSTITTAGSGNMPGTAQSITVETDGATFACSWTAAIYATAAMSSNSNIYAKYDLSSSSSFALAQFSANTEKATVANYWGGTITSAGTYTFQLFYTNQSTSQISAYTSLLTQIMEVA